MVKECIDKYYGLSASRVYILLLLAGATFPVFKNINDYLIVGKWVITVAILIVGLIVTHFLKKSKYHISISLTDVSHPAIIISAAIILYSALQYFDILPNSGLFKVNGGFDNPVGAVISLVLLMPSILFLADRTNNRKRQLLVYLFILLEFIYVLYLQSRTGIITMSILLAFYIGKTYIAKWKRLILILSTVCIPIIALIYLFAVKSGSTNGRILILGTCWEMFRDAPLFGHGFHSFDKYYMLYQAQILQKPEWSMYGIYADNVTHPLSEYMLILVQFGIVGLLLSLSVIAFIFRFMLRGKQKPDIYVIMTFVGVCILSLFTYPFRYPITAIAVLFCICDTFDIHINRLNLKITLLGTILLIPGLMLGTKWFFYQIKWYNSSNQELFKPDEYAKIYNALSNDPYFLYNYSVRLCQNGEPEKADSIVHLGFSRLANYDTALLMGDINRSLNLEKSIEYYTLASEMCPSRFVPLYNIFMLQKEKQNYDQMKLVGKKIIAMPVKVPSSTVRQIRLSVKQQMLDLGI